MSEVQCPLTVKVALSSLGVQGLTSGHGPVSELSILDVLSLGSVQSALDCAPVSFHQPCDFHQVLLSSTTFVLLLLGFQTMMPDTFT